MAVNSYDPTTGRPVFVDTDPPDIKVDPTEAGKYAADVGNSIVRASLTALEGYAYKRPGLLGYALDTNTRYEHDSTGWKSLGSSDTGWILSPSGILTQAPGWSIETFRIRKAGLSVAFYVNMARTGADIAVSNTGDMTNVPMGTLDAAWRPTGEQVLSSGNAGRMASGYVGSNGIVTLAAVGGTANITTGSGISLGGTIMQ